MDCALIVPIGTSMLSGWMRRLDPHCVFPAEWSIGQPAAPGGRPPRLEEWLPQFSQSLNQAESKTSAELDSIRKWQMVRSQARVRRVTLLVSDTPAAGWVADATQRLLPSVVGDAPIEQRTIPRLSPETMRLGLIEFIRVSSRAIRDSQRQGWTPIINATPGFKAEASLLTLEGALLGAETFYLHEQMQSIVTIPAIPLRWGLEEADVDLLNALGMAADRNAVRNLGLGHRRHLEGFVERLGDGQEEIWGLSALGELVLESTGGGETEPPPPRNERSAEFQVVEREQGHMPADAERLARTLGDNFNFVTRVQVYRFFGKPGRQGVLPARAEDIEEKVIRVRLHTPGNAGPPAVGLRLYTTAETVAQYRYASSCVGEHYGEVDLRDLLSDERPDLSEMAEISEAGTDFGALALEDLLTASLQRKSDECQQLAQQLQNVSAELSRVRDRQVQLEQSFGAAQTRIADLRKTVRQREAEISELRSQLAATQEATSGQGGDSVSADADPKDALNQADGQKA